jgi:hypothetical protein
MTVFRTIALIMEAASTSNVGKLQHNTGRQPFSQPVAITRANQLMLSEKIIAAFSGNHTKPTNTVVKTRNY